MSEPPPNPPGEQPRLLTGIELILESVSAAIVCLGFYAGYSLKGFWVGLFCGVVARVMIIFFMMAMLDWVKRRRRS